MLTNKLFTIKLIFFDQLYLKKNNNNNIYKHIYRYNIITLYYIYNINIRSSYFNYFYWFIIIHHKIDKQIYDVII